MWSIACFCLDICDSELLAEGVQRNEISRDPRL
jgi:hypothetical protein